MLKNMAFFANLLKTSIKASISKRGAFLIESGLMIANNLIFFSMWWIFFHQFNDVGGWNFNDITVLTAIGTGSIGLMQVCFGGVRTLSTIILGGDLDCFMTQPKNLLVHIASSKSVAKGWGSLMTSVALIALGGITAPSTIVLIFIGILSGCLVFTSMNVIAHSLPFWMGPVRDLSKKYCDSLFLFAYYPTNIYSGMLQVVMFTLIPAGVISYLPVELVRHFSWARLFLLLGSSLCFLSLAFIVFYCGLKRYESGNRFGSRL